MMHRYVAVISSNGASPAFAAMKAKLGNHLGAWPTVLDTDFASAWCFQTPPSQLGCHQTGPAAVTIGLQVPNQATSPESAMGPPAGFGTMLATTWGAYVSIAADVDRKTVRIARDPTGRIECWRLALPDADVIFSHFSDVQRLHPAMSLNWDYLIYHLNANWTRGDETGLLGVTEILPGEEITYDQSGSQKRTHWRPHEIAADQHASAAAARSAIRQAAEVSIREWASRYDSIALDLSGGLDSSIVLGLLRSCAHHPQVIGVNYITPHAEGDERRYARDAAEMHAVELVECELSASTIGPAPSFAARLLRPAIRSMPLGYDQAASSIAKRYSIDAFFSGTGGDHIFYDPLRLSAISDYRRDHGFSPGFVTAAHQLAQASKETIWNAFGTAAADWIRGPRTLRELLQRENPFLSAEVREGADYERFAHPWAREGHKSVPPAKLHQILNISELQRHYWRYGRADVAEEVHPLFSQPLMEACLRTPAYWFAPGGVQRGLARQLFADLLPERIRTRRSKGANTSHWVQVMDQHLPRTRELLLDGVLSSRGMLDRRKLEAALTPLGLAANKAFGPIINCLTTEMWIQGNGAASIRPPADEMAAVS